MSILRGKIFEKAGVNISTVFGDISSKLKGKIPGTKKNNYISRALSSTNKMDHMKLKPHDTFR